MNASMLDLVEALREAGLTIPEDVDSVEGLILAVRANRKRDDDRGGAGGTGDRATDQPGGPDPEPPAGK